METLFYTEHSRVRMQQRGIREWMVEAAVRHGERSWSHDATRYDLTDRALRRSRFAHRTDELRGLCVVVSREGWIITTKWDFHLARPGVQRRSRQSVRADRPRSEREPMYGHCLLV